MEDRDGLAAAMMLRQLEVVRRMRGSAQSPEEVMSLIAISYF